ncbi:MAG: hypothetical protein CL927_20585 [Deltaproteobacteria bacterium]|nr:hypothetical protein [Deltaproteobacteria bacterium]HCH66327.1 hypothetical protein [Deltaproteobacteria bacterium]
MHRPVPTVVVIAMIGLTACGSKPSPMLPTDSMFDSQAVAVDSTDAVDTGLSGTNDDMESDSGGPAGGDNDSGSTDANDGGAGDGSADGSGSDDGGADGGSDDSGADDGSDDSGDAGTSIADFSLEDLNPSSSTYGQPVSPRDLLAQTSGWYFVHST